MTITAGALLNSSLSILQQIWFRRRVEAVTIDPHPIIVLGHWRSGTTWCHELLCLDPRHVYPNSYCCFFPHHALLTERWLGPKIDLVAPVTRPMDSIAVSWDRPQEDEFAMMNLGLPSPYTDWAFPNNLPEERIRDQIVDVDNRQRERWKETFLHFLKQVALRNPGRLVLKSPLHAFRLKTIRELFPSACYVVIVREPRATLASTLRMWRSMASSQGLQTHRTSDYVQRVCTTFIDLQQELLDATEQLPQANLICLKYEELLAAPVEGVRRIYTKFGISEPPLFEYMIRQHVRDSNFQPSAPDPLPPLNPTLESFLITLQQHYGYA